MFENYDKSFKYLLACSGGPDSMALLDMLYNQNFNLIVAHVNYKTRDESDDEERLVKEYCNKRNIKCYVDYFNHKYTGSFEDAARKFRYNFFAKIYIDEGCKGLFVAHHKDDLLETYLLKKERNVVNESYLINENTIINNMLVIRPLLKDFYKDDLLEYCNKKGLKYGIDKTNFMDIHPRNVIRKKLTSMDKNAVFNKAIEEENNLIETRKNVKEFIKYYPVYKVDDLKNKNDLFLMIFLYELANKKYKSKINKSVLLSLKNFLDSDKPNLSFNIQDSYYLVKDYGKIYYKSINEQSFCYILNKIENISTPFFKIVDNGLKMEGIYLEESDFPITIRNYKKEDKIKLKEGTKKISRLFIDKKVPMEERNLVPVIENANHEIVFVYKLYRKYGLKYVKNNLFMLK